MDNSKLNQGREGFAFTAFAFGIFSLMTWRWTLVGTVLAVMSVGFGVIALKSRQRLVATIGVVLGIVGLVLSLTTAFLQWP
jgi:hypothetical protein